MFFKKKIPKFTKDDVVDSSKLADLLMWFMKNDKIVGTLKNNSCNSIFNEGFRPVLFKENNPQSFKENISTLGEWFGVQLKVDVSGLKEVSKEMFKEFLDNLGKISDKTLIVVGDLSIKYKMDMSKFNYMIEIQKINDINEKETFKHSFLLDSVAAAESRILAWLYHEWFSEWYKIN